MFHSLGALITALGMRTRPEIALIAPGFFVLHSFIPYQELRFLFPIVPLSDAQAVLQFDQLVIAQRGSLPGSEVAVDGERALIECAAACAPELTDDWHLE